MAQSIEKVHGQPKTEGKSTDAQDREPVDVLVVGDWLVDEHWAVGDHRAASSSRTGQRRVSSWITLGEQASLDALKAVNELASRFPNARIVVLPALVANLIGTPGKGLGFSECLERALSFTQGWMDLEEKRVTDYSWKPSDRQVLRLNETQAPEHFRRWRTFSWKLAEMEWERAFSELGVIEMTERTGKSFLASRLAKAL
jgi:hypothetical protein